MLKKHITGKAKLTVKISPQSQSWRLEPRPFLSLTPSKGFNSMYSDECLKQNKQFENFTQS